MKNFRVEHGEKVADRPRLHHAKQQEPSGQKAGRLAENQPFLESKVLTAPKKTKTPAINGNVEVASGIGTSLAWDVKVTAAKTAARLNMFFIVCSRIAKLG